MTGAITFAIVLVAAMVQIGTGFGFAIVAIPLLLFIRDGHEAVMMSVMLSLISCLSSLPRLYKDVDRRLLWQLILGSLVGLPLGGALFLWLDVQWLKLFVGIAIIGFTVPLLLRINLRLGRGKEVGIISGFLTSSVGMPGPPVVLLLASRNADKGTFRGTAIAYYCFVYIVSLLIYSIGGQIAPQLWVDCLWLIPAIVIGHVLGRIVHQKINHAWFQRVTVALLLVTAINAVIQSI